MRMRRLAPATVAAAASIALASPASAAPASDLPVPDYEMPFQCGQQWTGTSRAGHSPSALAVDFNRPADYGRYVVASAPGTVTRVADLGAASYGRYVIVDHGSGDTTLYAHLKTAWVVTGQRVDQGEILGQVGDTGAVSGAHLHFEERRSGTDRPVWLHQSRYVLGTALSSANCPDVPVTGNWDGVNGDEVAVFRRTTTTPVFRLYRAATTPEVVHFGLNRDLPVAGDWDGDGRTDLGVRRPGSRAFLLRGPDGSTRTVSLGRVNDRPVTGDWDGDGVTDVGVWRPATATFHLRTPQGVEEVPLGVVGSEPVAGDWNGDGRTDLGVFDPVTATFTLRFVAGDGTPWTATVVFGSVGDLPVTGDWDGNGTTDVGTWSPGTATYSLRTGPAATSNGRTTARVTTLRFGRPR